MITNSLRRWQTKQQRDTDPKATRSPNTWEKRTYVTKKNKKKNHNSNQKMSPLISLKVGTSLPPAASGEKRHIKWNDDGCRDHPSRNYGGKSRGITTGSLEGQQRMHRKRHKIRSKRKENVGLPDGGFGLKTSECSNYRRPTWYHAPYKQLSYQAIISTKIEKHTRVKDMKKKKEKKNIAVLSAVIFLRSFY